MNQEISFGNIIREHRRTRDLTQAELARRVGCATITIRKIEAGALRPSVQIAERLAMALNIPLEERAKFVRLARTATQPDPSPSPLPTPPLTPGEVGLEDLSGRAIRGYELGERLAMGGFGAVYRSVQPLLDREVAIKIILPQYANHPDFIRRFEAEAQLVARLEHPYIVPLYDFWREPGVAYLVMRLLRGGSLHSRLKHGPLPLEFSVRLLQQVTNALHSAHRVGVVHRDIKPANILLDEDDNAYLADFGFAKNLGNPNLEHQTQAGTVIGSLEYISPEQIQAEPIRPQADIYCLGVTFYEMLTGRKPFAGPTPIDFIQQHLREPLPSLAVSGNGADGNAALAALDPVIARATDKNPDRRYPDALALLDDVHRILANGAAPPASTAEWPATVVSGGALELENPYRGLRAFGEADADNFFGRESLTQELLGRLGESHDLARFLAVVGPSGSGKSSLVKAGLIPALRRGGLPGSENWFIVDFMPGAHPLEELEAALLRVAASPPDSLLAQLRRNERGLHRALKRILPADESVELVLVIDQFEELFTLVDDEDERAHFLSVLVTALLDERSRLRLVITLRADFTDRPLHYVDFGELVRHRAEFVLPLTPDELEQAITQPAARLGLTWEPGLVPTLITDVGDQPGTLPLLQYTLTELFERRDGRRLTLAAYQAGGGVLGTLAHRADELYNNLDKAGRNAARQLFLRLVTPGEGAGDTRRRVLRTELESLVTEDAPPIAETIENRKSKIQNGIDQFGKYRLLTFDHDPVTRDPTVEVAHEALLREWGRLRQWLAESREDIRLQRLLSAAVAEWHEAGRDPGFLLHGSRLDQFEDWAKETTVALTAEERVFLQASIAARQEREAAEEARLQRELETAQKLAETERQRAEEQTQAAGRLRQRAVFLGIALLIAGVLAVAAGLFGVQSSQHAEQARQAQQTAEARRQLAETARTEAVAAQLETEREARRATASQLAAQAQIVLESGEDPAGTLPLLLAREAVLTTLTEDGYFTPEADAALRQVVDSVPVLLQSFSGHTDRVVAADFSPDGKTLATGSDDQTIRLWDVDTGQELQRLQGHTLKVWSVDFGPDGKTLASASPDRTVRLWNVATGEELRRFEGHTGSVNWVVFNPDGSTIATSGGRISGHPNPSLGKAPKFDDTIRLWDVVTGKEIKRIAARVPPGALSAFVLGDLSAFSPDGKTLVTPGEDRTARLWDVATGAEIRRFEGHTAAVSGAVFSPDGQTILTAGDDQTVRLWDVATGAEIHRFDGYAGAVRAANFSPDGQTIIASSFDPATERFDRIVRLWDVATGAETYRLANPTAGVTFATFSPDGHSIVTISESPDNTVRLWAAKPKGEIRRLEANSPVRSVAVSPDGQAIVTAGANNRVRLWDAATGEEITRLEGHTGRVNAVAFSPDGHMLASAGFDKTIRLWDIETNQEVKRFEGHTGTIESLAFSPNGQSIATAAEDKTTRLWDVATGREIQRFAGHSAGVSSVAFRPDGQTIATGGDKTVRLWDVETGEEIHRLEGHTSIVRSVDFSPDGQTIVSAGTTDTIVRLWDVERGREIGQFEGHKSRVNVAVFSPSGQTVASAGKDGSVLVWDVDSRSVIRRLDGHTSFVFAAAFSPDGQFIVTAGNDRTARIWPGVEALLAEAESLIQRNPPEFTPEERVRFGLGL